MPRSAEDQFHEDMNALTRETREFLHLLEDAFKAPEIKIEAIYELQRRLWNAQLSYYALCHPRHERDEDKL